MAPVTAVAGVIACSKDLLRTSLANCHFFRELGNWTVEQAKDHIYLDVVERNLGDIDEVFSKTDIVNLRPFALIYKTGSLTFELAAEPAGYVIRGELSIMFERNASEFAVNSAGEIERLMENMVGQIMMGGDAATPGLAELSRISHQGYLHILGMADDGPYRVREEKVESAGDHLRHYIDVQWGSNA